MAEIWLSPPCRPAGHPALALRQEYTISMRSLCPPTLTAAEQRALLASAASHPRDHALFSLALGTGLRLAEIVGLKVGDLFLPDGQPRSRFRLRPEVAKRGRAADVFLPEAVLPKLRRLRSYKLARGEGFGPGDPLFSSGSGRRLSKRRVQAIFHERQLEAGFDRIYPFHALRHSAITSVYRLSRDLFLAQRFARHASPMTTIVYTHVSDEEMRDSLRDLAC